MMGRALHASSHMGTRMELSNYPPHTQSSEGPHVPGLWHCVHFSWSLYAAAHVTQSLESAYEYPFHSCVVEQLSICSVCLGHLYTDSEGKPWRQIYRHPNTTKKQRACNEKSTAGAVIEKRHPPFHPHLFSVLFLCKSDFKEISFTRTHPHAHNRDQTFSPDTYLTYAVTRLFS